jgi:5-methylcytosine-specific restriction endonuclease McrA
MWHKLSNINESKRTAVCALCGPVELVVRSKKKVDGSARYGCRTHYNNRRNNKKKPYRKHKKDICERCGFIPEYSIQLDVDHIDGNHHNNDETNLQTLCANCHRLKTYLNKDHTKQKEAPTQDFS